MKILVIGAGAIGGSLACYLYAGGHDVTVLEKNKEICEVINRDGAYLRDGDKTYHARVKAVSELDDEKYDCCFSATRAYHLKGAVASVLNNVKEDGFIFSMNNGVCIEPLLDVVDKSRAVWCSINYGAGIEDKGKYYIKIHGNVVIGGVLADTRELVEFKDKLTTPLKFSLTDNVLGALYSKMLINSCITSTAVVSGLSLGEILGEKTGKKVFLGIIREGVAVAKSAGVKIPKYRGLDYYTFASKGLFGRLYRLFLFPYLGKKYGKRTSATLESLRAGAKTEIDYFNGFVVRQGEKFGVPTPVNIAVVNTVKEVEADLNKICADRLKDCLAVKGE